MAEVTGETRSGPFVLRWSAAGSGPRVLLLHGVYAGASRYEWREVAPRLVSHAQVRTPDLLGTGESDHPDLEYTPEVLLDSLADLVADAEPMLTVASSLTGAYALRLAAAGRLPGDLALITPTGLPGTSTSRSGLVGALAQQALLRTPLGDALVAGVASRPSVGWFLRNRAYADASLVTDEVVAAHVRVAGRPDAKQLLVAFITQRLALALTPDEIGGVRPLVLWGRGERFSRVESAERWRAAGAEVVLLPSGLPQVEQPDEVAAALLARLAR